MKYTDEQRIAKIIEVTDKLADYVRSSSLTRDMVMSDEKFC